MDTEGEKERGESGGEKRRNGEGQREREEGTTWEGEKTNEWGATNRNVKKGIFF